MSLGGRTLIVAFMAITFSSWIIQQSGALIESKSMPLSATDYNDMFSIAVFDVSTITAAISIGGLIGIVGIIFKQYIFASIALIIWVVGILWKPSNAFITAFPKLLEAIIPAEVSWLAVIPTSFITIAFFFWFIEIVAQRNLP